MHGKLTAFIRARLDEDERVTYNPALMPVAGPGLSNLVKRARADIEAKRRTLERHAQCGSGNGYCDDGGHAWEAGEGGETFGGCADLLDLAAPWSDHRDYDPAWHPAA